MVNDETLCNVTWEDGPESNYQLTELLIQLAGEEPNLSVEACGQHGLEAWRRLNAKHDPYTRKHELDKIDTLMNVTRARDYKNIGAKIQAPEREMRLYAEKTNFDIPESWTTNILMKMVPTEYETQLRMRCIRGFNKYDEVRQTIMDSIYEFAGPPRWRLVLWVMVVRQTWVHWADRLTGFRDSATPS